MRRIKYKTSVSLLIVLASVVLVLLCLLIVHTFRTGEEATVGIFSLAATLVGTLFIAIELKNGSDVTCSEMLIDLNNYFHDSDRLMKVYEILETAETEGDYGYDRWKDVSSVEVAQYCTFFENLYLLYRHHIANIEDLDDLFGYRFFLFMNNPYIQENYILPTSSSYVQVFELYKIWIKHREKENSGQNGWKRHVPCSKFMFPESYLENKLYLFDDGLSEYNKTVAELPDGFRMKTLGFDSLSAVMQLQDEVVDGLEDKKLFFSLSREELIESLQRDNLCGIVSPEGKLAAFSVVVNNREGCRSLASDLGLNPCEVLTFDAVVVSPAYRGRGFHRHFIDWSVALAKQKSCRYILATVDPKNIPSERNFLAKGFVVADTRVKYEGLLRDILKMEI